MIIGEGTYFAEPIQIRGDSEQITIGKYCSVAKNVVLGTAFNHNTSFVSTYPFLNLKGIGKQNIVTKPNINIGNDVWICENVLIMGNVNIGNGAVIGANSIVTKDVREYDIVVGSPAKVIKQRFSSEQIKYLQFIKWWDWSTEKILSELPFADNIEEFINKHI